jgi:AraC-like DNA-binding protein/ligand-binding sensor domain-containing protein
MKGIFGNLPPKKFLCICTAILLTVVSATAGFAFEVSDFTYSHIGKTDGIGNQRIFSVCQTNDGAIWWSSKTDVCRYNGSMVRNFPLCEGMPVAHLGARVIQLVADSSHIYAYDNRSYIFEYAPIQDRFVPIKSKKLAHEGLNSIHVSGGNMYLCMYDGVFLLQDTTLTEVMKGAHVNKIVQTKNHMLFCAREGVFNEQGRKLLPYNIESGFYDPLTGRLWLGSYERGLILAKMHGTNDIVSDREVRLSNGQQYPIRCICPYDEDTMLIGIDGLGVYQMSRDGTGDLSVLFDANESRHGVLHGNGVYSMVVDKWKNIVIGTYSGGIDIARPIGSTTAIYRHIPNNRQSLQNDRVNTVLSLSEQLLVMGGDNGVSILNTETNTWQHCCQGAVVLNLCKRPDGKVLVSTYGKGIYEMDSHGTTRQLYTTANGQLKDDHVYSAAYDQDGNLWIGSLNGDLLQLEAGGDSHHYPVHYVQALLQLPSGQMAVGTAFGLKLVTPGNNVVEELNYAPAGTDDVNIFVNHLLLDGQKLWIATDGGGIYVWHLQKKNCQQITTTNGLPSNHVSCLAKGDDGRIWIGTDEGLAFISPDNTSKAVNVNYCYGLDREYGRGVACCLPNGDVLFGSSTGAVVVHPENVQPLNYTAKLNILGISCNSYQQKQFQEEVFHMLSQNKIKLTYRQNTFDLFFESINMRNHFDIAYRYRIDKGEWSLPSKEQHIRFVSLEPGSHLLTLQCISKTSGTVIDTLTLPVTIGQPWWNSWWMWCVYIALLLLAFYGAWRIYELQEKYMRLTIDYLQLSQQNLESDTAEPVSDILAEPAASDEEKNGGKEFVDKATHLILERLSDTDFNIDRLCREMAMSRTLFYVKLKSYTGKSPQDFIRIIRLERAATLLRNGRSVTDAAALAGFDNPKYFSTVFKKYFGVSPSKYQ